MSTAASRGRWNRELSDDCFYCWDLRHYRTPLPAASIVVMAERTQATAAATSSPMIKWFGELTASDVATVGGKNASLGEMFTLCR